ncbi:MAG: diacylglycerol kinase family lipid kinase [Bacteroidia bacterium]
MGHLFLINPASGHRRDSARTERLIQTTFAGTPVRVEPIDFARLDTQLQAARQQGLDHIFAVGGDGTVNAVGTRLAGTDTCFGVVPHGSGNGYARNLGYSIHPGLALRQARTARPIWADTGRFAGVPFLNVAGVGLDATVAHAYAQGKQRGFLPYALNAARGLMQFRSEDYTLHIDGVQRTFHDILGVLIANGTQWGYDARITTEARLSDGLLDILVVRKFPLIEAGLVVGRLFSGQFQDSRYVEGFRARHLVIERAAPGYAQIDGEPIEAGARIEVEIIPHSLRLLLPGTLTEAKAQSI